MPPITTIHVGDTGSQSGDTSAKPSHIYTNKFFEERQTQAWQNASRIVPKVLEVIQPGSVIDVGCGTGEFLAVFKEHGIENILGIDGAYVDRNLLTISQENFIPFDLNQPFTLDHTFDLVICLEVAEHLKPESAEGFIASLTSLASIILFSAAIPYQGGTNHLNEQWPEYWADLFKQHNFVPIDALRRSIWHDREITFPYRQNILFFCTKEAGAANENFSQAYKATNPDALSIVHPDLYLARNTKYLRTMQHISIYLDPLRHIEEMIRRRFRNT